MRTIELSKHLGVGRLLVLVIMLTLTQTVSAASSPKTPATIPAAVARAQELAALPDGGWLVLDKQTLRLLDGNGKERAKLPMRAKHLDTRPHARGVFAVLIDADTQRPIPLLVDVKAGTIQAQSAFPLPQFAVETACLYRDAQQLDYLFLVGKNGVSEQWLLQGESPRLVRKLALPPQAKHCRSDDLSHTLLVSEADLGLWAYAADPEASAAIGNHLPLALRAPFGRLQGGAGAFVVLPGGVALIDTKSENLHLLRLHQGQWQHLAQQRLRFGHEIGQLGLREVAGGMQLLLRDEQAKTWHVQAQPWKRTLATGKASDDREIAIIQAQVQTDPVARYGDAADDPAIWVNQADTANSRVLGTNKKQGLLVYDMAGKQLQLLESGRLNNVDLRQNLQFGGQSFDLAVATQRDENSLVVFAINAGGEVAEAARIATDLDKIYGTCLYRPLGGGLEVFVNDKDGRFQQIRIERSDQGFTGRVVRRFKLASQPEGCVADDKNAKLYLGEEKRGIWLASAAADSEPALQLILPVGPQLHADVEGMAIYFGAKQDYLLVSSQGDSSYLVLDAQAPYRVRGKFRVGVNPSSGIDGTSETDGLDVSSVNFGGKFSAGMLVVQDGNKRLPDGPQNFKYVAWEDIARALKLPLP
ncbi:phytase [Undibacterium sp. Ren11W]|uniref:phytase n=1 Tax=Undibacterium sp. Ren11W TaxID=3413045 RepID=UPI003BF30CA0